MALSIQSALRSGNVLLLDGGVGSELQRRGVQPDEKVWCATGHLRHPEAALEVHRDYISSGAQIVTANTFAGSAGILRAANLDGELEAINRSAVELAKRARDEAAKPDVWIAGSLSTMPPFSAPHQVPQSGTAMADYRRQAQCLARAGVDLLMVELVLESRQAPLLVSACLETGLPVTVGFSCVQRPGKPDVWAFRTSYAYTSEREETLSSVLEAVLTKDVAAAGIMHTKLPVMRPALEVLAAFWHGPMLAYAEIGRFDRYKWEFDEAESPEHYAEAAISWVRDFGVQVVGGCCGTHPGHIAELVRRLRTR